MRLVLDQIAVDGSIPKAPGGGEVAGRSPVGCGKQGLRRSGMTDGYGIPLGRLLAGANRHDSPLLARPWTPWSSWTVARRHHRALDADYDLDKACAVLDERGLRSRIAHKGEKALIQASQRWHVERSHVWQNAFHRLVGC